MLNLIPDQQKKGLRLERIFFQLRTFSFLITGTILIITLFFIGNFWLLNKTMVQTQENILVSEINLSGIENLKEDIVKFNNNLIKANRVQEEHINAWQLMTDFSQLVPAGVTINTLTLDFAEAEAKINFQGTAENRDALLSFQENLNQNDKFKDFDYPLGSLVEKENIDFIFEGKIVL